MRTNDRHTRAGLACLRFRRLFVRRRPLLAPYGWTLPGGSRCGFSG